MTDNPRPSRDLTTLRAWADMQATHPNTPHPERPLWVGICEQIDAYNNPGQDQLEGVEW